MTEYTILRPDGNLYRGTNGPDVWRDTSRGMARAVLAVLNSAEPGHRLLATDETGGALLSYRQEREADARND